MTVVHPSASRRLRLPAVALASCLALTPAASLGLSAAPADTAPVADLSAEAADDVVQTERIRATGDGMERISLPVRLGGQGPFSFIIDTGSQRTVVASAVLRRLSLTPDGNARIVSMTGRSDVETISIPELDYGNHDSHSVVAAVLEQENIGGHGLLGLDSLQDKQLTMDFKRNAMRITRSGRVRMTEGDGAIVVTARRKSGQLILVDSRIGKAKVNVVLDTGAEISIGNMALKQRLRERDLLMRPQPMTLTSVTGESVQAEYAMVRSIEVGGVILNNASIVFVDAPPFAELGLDKQPAMLLGMQMIRLFETVSIDFGRRRVQFQMRRQSATDPDTRLAMK